jgi:hypothetical protein
MRKWTWVLFSLPIFFGCAGCDFEPHVPAEMVMIHESQDYGSEKSLNAVVRLDVGSLAIESGKGMGPLYSFDLEYDKSSFEPVYRFDSDTADGGGRFTFNLPGIPNSGFRKNGFGNYLQLKFNDAVPLNLEVDTEVANARLSLSGLRLSSLSFQAGVGGTRISVYEPNPISCDRVKLENGVGSLEAVGLGNLNFREFEFEGGVGGADLEFTGSWKQDAEVQIQVGVGGVNIRMPRSVGVRVETEENFLSGTHLEGFIKKGSDYYSRDYEDAPVKVRMRVVTHIGGFKISWI